MRYAVISTSNDPEYYSLIPLVAYSWHKLGYTPIVIMVNCRLELHHLLTKYSPKGTLFRSLQSYRGVKDGSIAQLARLYMPSELDIDDTMITGDGDMIVMKDIFIHEDEVTSYGYDLTGRSQIPICYVKATVRQWQELMNMDMESEYYRNNMLFKQIADGLGDDIFSHDWNAYWDFDQKSLTAHAFEYGHRRITFVDRGFSGPVAAGRWDRYNWDVVPAEIIDVHCIRGLHRWHEITAMAEYLFPGEVGWMGELKADIDQLQHAQP